EPVVVDPSERLPAGEGVRTHAVQPEARIAAWIGHRAATADRALRRRADRRHGSSRDPGSRDDEDDRDDADHAVGEAARGAEGKSTCHPMNPTSSCAADSARGGPAW